MRLTSWSELHFRDAMTDLLQFYSTKYEPNALRSRRPNTKRLYRTTLKMFVRYLNRTPDIADLNDDTVNAFAMARLDAGLSKFSVNKDLSNLLAIWRWAHRKGYVTNWPDVELEETPEKTPVALLQEELERVRRAIESEHSPVGNFAGCDFWLAMFLLCWDTGERITPVVELTWAQVDLKNRWVRFDSDDRKGARADNMLPIAQETADAIAKLKPHDGKVFKWPYSPTYIYRRLGRIMTRAGLPDDRLHKFHCIRKSTASHYEAAGGNATELLKHSSRKVTKAYLDPRIVRPIPAVDLLFRPGQTG